MRVVVVYLARFDPDLPPEHARTMAPLRFSDLLEELDAHAQCSLFIASVLAACRPTFPVCLALIPAAVRQEITGALRSFVEKQVETWYVPF